MDEDVRLTDPADLEAAIQAAWIAGPAFAAELAKLHGLYDKTCLCCAREPLAAITPTKALVDAYNDLAFQLCLDCHYSESRKLLVQRMAALDHSTNPCAEIPLESTGVGLSWGELPPDP